MIFRRPSVPPQTAYVLANLPEKVRITWADHRLYGAELPVHGWHHVQGEIHLVVTLPDGSRTYFPAAGTALFGASEHVQSAVGLTVDGVRQLRQLITALQDRGRRRRGAGQQTSK
jgi:hypothetical protein